MSSEVYSHGLKVINNFNNLSIEFKYSVMMFSSFTKNHYFSFVNIDTKSPLTTMILKYITFML